jgi:hypothetical protein
MSAERRRRRRTVGGAALGGQRSAGARKLAAAILEVLAGARTPQSAAEALGLSLPRYYQVEQRGLEGLLEACEPRPRGRAVSVDGAAVKLRRENERLQREVLLQQALVRLAQRSVGLSPPAVATAPRAGKKRRPRRPTARGLAVAQRLRQEEAGTPAATTEPTGV